MATRAVKKLVKKKVAPPRKASNKRVSKNPTKKTTKKSSSSRPAATKTKKQSTPKKVVNLKKVLKKSTSKTRKKVVKPKSDTDLSCHRCGKTDRVNFEYVWNNGWPMCCREGMHIEDSDIKIGEVMNKAWIESGGYGNNFTLKN